MSIQSQTLKAIQEGRWALPLISPAFRKSLEKSLQGLGIESESQKAGIPFWELTFLRYKNDRPLISTLKTPRNLRLIASTRNESVFSQILETHHGLQEFSPGRQIILENAVGLIRHHEPDSAPFLSEAVFFAKAKDVVWRSASSPHIFGVIALSDKTDSMSEETLSISIVHELAHQELFLINLIDRLVNAESDYSLVHAPFQGVARPPIGRLHSLYALFRMISYSEKLRIDNHKYRLLFEQTKATFLPNELTEFAAKLVACCGMAISKEARDSRT